MARSLVSVLQALLCTLMSSLVVSATEHQLDHKDAVTSWSLGLNTSRVVYAVNCGGDSFTDDIGLRYLDDRDFEGGQTTSGCGNHRWPMTNMQIYHAERWGEYFKYSVPISDESNSHHTLVLKFSECYFWEPGMKVFDVYIGDVAVIKGMDPFLVAGGKLLPADIFVDLTVKQGKLYVNNVPCKGGIVDDRVVIEFKKGKSDNPKINAIILVEGGHENTHKKTYDDYHKAMMDHTVKQQEARERAEQFFAEDAYDYEEQIDGRGPFNQFLKKDYALELSALIFVFVFFRVTQPTAQSI